MINILIVDDSRTETKILKMLFESELDMKVVGIAYNGKEAVDMVHMLKPDIITMDLEMPVIDGHTATRLIMSQCPTPIVIISSKLNNTSVDMTFLALEAGAVSVIPKPVDLISDPLMKSKKQIIDTIRSMAEIKVIKRRFITHTHPKAPPILKNNHNGSVHFEIIGIGTSIGGPQVLKNILSKIPLDFSLPIVIVQHMSKGFISGFTHWLNQNTSLKVKVAENNEVLKKGVVYFAPDDFHLTVVRSNNQLMSQLISGEPVSGFCPSISVLLQSIAKTCQEKAIGILLTGMGADGAQGLLDLKLAKGHTLIQDEKSCVVFGMAGVAQSIGAVDKIVSVDEMVDYLIEMTTQKKSS